MNNYFKIVLILLGLISILFFIRFVNPSQIDDISPEIFCPEIEIYNPDILYVIPNFNNKPISENEHFCEYILSLNKTLALHGISHSPYQEFFYESITQEEINFAIEEFEKCFNQTPKDFKPPQLKISKENEKLILENDLKVRTYFNQITHKVYHCRDSGKFSNWMIKIF